MRVDIIHRRDPDSECHIEVYLDGKLVGHEEWSFDPGAGYDMDEFEEMKREAIEGAPEFLKPVLADIYDEMKSAYERSRC